MFSARQVMCRAKIGQFDIHGRRPSINYPGRAADGSCRVSEKFPSREHAWTAPPFLALSRRTLTRLSRRRWSRAAHSTAWRLHASEEKVQAAIQICEKGGRNRARRAEGGCRASMDDHDHSACPLLPALLCIETQEGKPGWPSPRSLLRAISTKNGPNWCHIA